MPEKCREFSKQLYLTFSNNQRDFRAESMKTRVGNKREQDFELVYIFSPSGIFEDVAELFKIQVIVLS